MAYAFVAATSQGNASGGALTVTKPPGTVDGHLILIAGYLESDTNSWSGVGAGFTALRSDANAGAFNLRLWWKVASGEPASWTWTPAASGWRTVVALTYTGNTGTGNQVDVDGTAQILDGDTTPDAPSVTTTVANDLLLAVHANFQGNAATETGAATTERADFGGVVVSDALSVAAGATGATTFSAGTVDHVTRHLAMLLASGGGTTTVTLAGQPGAETPGTPALTPALALQPASLTSAEAAGAASLTPGPISLALAGIGPGETLGAPAGQALSTLLPSGLASAETPGAPGLTLALAVQPPSLASAETAGAATAQPGPVSLTPAAIAAAESAGAVQAGQLATVSLTGQPSGAAFGAARAAAAATLIPSAVAGAETAGAVSAQPGPVSLTPAAIAGTEALGAATPVLALTVALTGVPDPGAPGGGLLVPGPATLALTGLAGAEAFGMLVGVAALAAAVERALLVARAAVVTQMSRREGLVGWLVARAAVVTQMSRREE